MDTSSNGISKRGQNDHATHGSGLEQRDGKHVRSGSERRYQRLFATAHDGILLLDANTGRIIDANPFMTNLLGLSHDELLGKELWEVGLLRDTERRSTPDELREPGFIRHEDHFLQSAAYPDGIDVEVVSNRYEEGDHQVIQCHVRDITERKRAALSTAGQVEDLLVAGRHKDEFLAVLSHELRNVLAPVANALQVLRLEQEAVSLLPNRGRLLIERQMGQLSHLVDDLLDVSGIAAGRLRFQPARIDLRVVVQRSVETVFGADIARHHQVTAGHHQVTIAVPHDPIWLEGDAARMEQAVVNLLMNAVKYTDDGGRIAVHVTHGPGRAELRISDSGIGMVPEELARVFDPFVRAEGARQRSPAGLGFGLTIVRRIVEMHGGSVVAHSAGLGAGSEFVVFLPLATAAG